MNCDHCNSPQAKYICSHCYLGSWCSLECQAKNAQEHEDTLCFLPEDLDEELQALEKADSLEELIAARLIANYYDDTWKQWDVEETEQKKTPPPEASKLQATKARRKSFSKGTRGEKWRENRRRRFREWAEKKAKEGQAKIQRRRQRMLEKTKI